MGGDEPLPPENSRVKNFLYHLIFGSKTYIPNLGSLGPPIVALDTCPGVGGCGWVLQTVII